MTIRCPTCRRSLGTIDGDTFTCAGHLALLAADKPEVLCVPCGVRVLIEKPKGGEHPDWS